MFCFYVYLTLYSNTLEFDSDGSFFHQEESTFCPSLCDLCFITFMRELEFDLSPNTVLLRPSALSHDLLPPRERGRTFIYDQPLWVLFCLSHKWTFLAENLVDSKAPTSLLLVAVTSPGPLCFHTECTHTFLHLLPTNIIN